MPIFTRPDGTLARDVPAYRRLMPYLMRTRNESAVYFDQQLDLTRTVPFLQRFNMGSSHRATVFHVFLYAAVRVMHERPRLNRFVAGGRIWQRDGIWVSFSAKKSLSDDAPIVVVKRRLDPTHDFATMMASLGEGIREGRSEKKSTVDKELAVILALPGPLIRLVMAAQRFLDGWGLLPRAMIDTDPMYASLFVANLGSLKMEAASHHLYEYGNIPIFAAVGRVKNVPTVRDDGSVASHTVCDVKYTFDERVEDGLYCAQAMERLRHIVEDPDQYVTLPRG
ncbi:MAG: 2-oxo acid dehydrogenase subunit E2 [Myxococcota bacterium]